MSPHPDDTRLQLAAEGLLDDDDAGQIEEHLEGCGRCREVVESYLDLLTQLNAVPVAEAPAALADAVLEAYHRTSQPMAALWSDRKLFIAFALCNVLLTVIATTAIGLQGPLNLITELALGIKDLVVSAVRLLPVAEAIWTGMAHGGLVVVVGIALMLVTTVAALRRTVNIPEEMR
jgi:anti-sigma factor RsiW